MPFSTGNGGQNFPKVAHFNCTEYDLQILYYYERERERERVPLLQQE